MTQLILTTDLDFSFFQHHHLKEKKKNPHELTTRPTITVMSSGLPPATHKILLSLRDTYLKRELMHSEPKNIFHINGHVAKSRSV